MILVVTVLALTGCKTYTPADWAFLEAADKYQDAVGAPFAGYVAEDSELTDTQKESRLAAHRLFVEAVRERRNTMTQGR